MEKKETSKVLYDSINFFQKNIDALYALRPKCRVHFTYNGRVAFNFTIDNITIDEFEGMRNILPAINASLVIQGFSLFEASFERLLIDKLNTENLTGIQEKVMMKYIDDVIKLSSEERLASEFKFITGENLKTFFLQDEYKMYELIKTCYTLRHLLVHGSATKRVMVPHDLGGQYYWI